MREDGRLAESSRHESHPPRPGSHAGIALAPVAHVEVINLDMCNWRQSDSCMSPGARWMALMPRGFRKSTVFTHGANAWLLTRNGNEKIRLVNAIISRAEDFKYLTQRTFDSNALYAALYGPGWSNADGSSISSRVPAPNSKDWNAEKMVMPNRSRFAVEPSIKAAGITGLWRR